jgi:CRISPR-associated protein (TIGR03984 family)
MNTRLCASTSETDLTLEEALRACRPALLAAPAVALLYSPSRCLWGLFGEEEYLTGEDGRPIDLRPVYEARVFNRDAELRWLNTSGGRGRGVLISEQDFPGSMPAELAPVEVVETVEQTYLLWGEGLSGSPSTGWSYLAAARVGRLAVPVAQLAQRQRVQLKAREYLVTADEHGNVTVADERLLGLEVIG